MTDTTPMPDAPRRAPLHFADDSERESNGDGNTLDDAARDETEYARNRLRNELGREPTDAEIDEWLRDHTEGY